MNLPCISDVVPRTVPRKYTFAPTTGCFSFKSVIVPEIEPICASTVYAKINANASVIWNRYEFKMVEVVDDENPRRDQCLLKLSIQVFGLFQVLSDRMNLDKCRQSESCCTAKTESNC